MNNHVVYGLLLALTGLSYGIAEGLVPAGLTVSLVMGLACVKFLLVTSRFMHLRAAHRVWKIVVSGFAVVFSAIFALML